MKIFIFLVVAIFSILPNISLAANGSCGGRYSCSSGVLGATAQYSNAYQWWCNGNPGTNVLCTEWKINGSCAATHNSCSAGVTGATATYSNSYQWWCNSPNGGTNALCTEWRPVAGSCSASHYSCSAGTSASNVNGSTSWTWSCNGLYGGSTAYCSEAKPVNGSCAATHNSCNTGTTGATATYTYPSFNPEFYHWWCNGSNGGTNVLCSETIPLPSCSATHYGCSNGVSVGTGDFPYAFQWSCKSPVSALNIACIEWKPVTSSLTASPTSVAYGQRATLTWSATAGTVTNCTAGGPWSNSGTLSGSGLSDPLTSSATFTFQCYWVYNNLPLPLQSVTVSVITPSATLSVSQNICTIATGSKTCTVPFTWQFTNATNPILQNNNIGGSGMQVSASGTNVQYAITNGLNEVVVKDGSTTLKAAYATGSCAAGITWVDGTGCVFINVAPTASISSPAGNTSVAQGTAVSFSGVGNDANILDGIGAYEWREGNCSTGTLLSSASSFNLSTPSAGARTIFFRVRDLYGPTWSTNCPSRVVTVTSTNTSTSPAISINPTTYYVGVSNTYTFIATDIQNDQVRYGIDWNMDGAADEWLPVFPGYVNSGTSRSTSYTWPTTGNKQFQALTQDYQGSNSAWTVRNITVTDAPCANNTINPPTCTQCADNIAYANGGCVDCSTGGCFGTGGNSTNGNSTLTCNSGAINIPNCTVCPGGQTLVGSMCVNNCTNGATNPTTCDACPVGQELIGGICTVTTSCGDSTCNGSETILTCPADCKVKYQQF